MYRTYTANSTMQLSNDRSHADTHNRDLDMPSIPSCDPVLDSFGSPSSDPTKEEKAIRHFLHRIIQHRCPTCRRETMADDSRVLFAYTQRMMYQTIMAAASKGD